MGKSGNVTITALKVVTSKPPVVTRSTLDKELSFHRAIPGTESAPPLPDTFSVEIIFFEAAKLARFSARNRLEHRAGIEPANTGFADQRVSHFATGAHPASTAGEIKMPAAKIPSMQ